MWLFTPIGFFSIVQKDGSNVLTIRARVGEDLDALRQTYMPSLSETQAKGGTDYPYRAVASHAAFSEALAKIGAGIGYDNFKDEVANCQGLKRSKIYGRVWTTLLDLEGTSPKAKPKAKDKVPAAGGVVINDAGQVLLVEPRDHFDGYVWTFPKGRPKKDESAEACAEREVMERTGVIPQAVAEIPGRFAGGTTSNQYFLMKTGMFNTLPKNPKIVASRWAGYAEARALIRKSLTPTGMERDLAVLDAGYLAWQRSLIADRHRFEQRVPTTRESWKVNPMKGKIASLRIDRTFSEGEMDQIRRGHLPKEMEDKWFMFFENNCLHACRSWTGDTIYLVAFAKASSGTWRIDDVNLPKEVLKDQGTDHAGGLLLFLIDAMLLGTKGSLPMMADASPQTAAMNAWHEVGKAAIDTP
jgi:8-oxo-dGTP pyrophosphatase MutT (NUDIX family)